MFYLKIIKSKQNHQVPNSPIWLNISPIPIESFYFDFLSSTLFIKITRESLDYITHNICTRTNIYINISHKRQERCSICLGYAKKNRSISSRKGKIFQKFKSTRIEIKIKWNREFLYWFQIFGLFFIHWWWVGWCDPDIKLNNNFVLYLFNEKHKG